MGSWTLTHTNLDHLTSWDAAWKDLRVVVAGLGLSGFSAADTLIELGAQVIVVDGSDSDVNVSRADTLKIVGAVDVLLGTAHTDELPLINGEAPQLVIASPGWNPRQPMLAAAAEAGIEIWGDVELAWRVRAKEGRKLAEWVVITGTNGKTTTVSMTESIFRAAGLRAIAAGNVGTPILDAIRDPEGFDVIALELSSFQLHFTHTISPLASVVLNIAEDHVDWHGGFENYKADKAKIYERTRVAAIYNADAREIEEMVENADVIDGCRAIGFTTGVPGLSMVGLVEDLLVDRAFIEDRRNSAAELIALDQIGEVVPRHTASNAAAAAALARAYGVEPQAVARGLANFDAGDHRIQAVARRDDILWINDSKATNPHAANASLGAFGSVVWIAGGLSKGVDYNEIVSAHAHRLRAVVLIGTDTSKLVQALERHAPKVPIIRTQVRETGDEISRSAHGWAVMSEAVNRAAEVAEAGDTVLMAPAAASMDQFSSYAQRGNAFIEAVRALMGEDTK
ncbi:UDP-N-acetylmuramoyl-L-alanine--D-glutamate ligase [Arthrobacter sp. MYb227]|uniref:UDP-N-acetylmuramoyl-L-alanine--D-glutamate ligase n=1 Tax=Arthrobacter sp. MYb227 TaxID=1848601 RepID=UPI000CFAD164|nr:UDP-N-acetylmuramoyl-L-alanine--D-glutamate ligase [Arthrobacter sp. MYb227]PQZ95876.1 UDP-N-acetylmuramoyl-L-alanine--D-glutamate ligase [Arthrobacter sp. MYb227]